MTSSMIFDLVLLCAQCLYVGIRSLTLSSTYLLMLLIFLSVTTSEHVKNIDFLVSEEETLVCTHIHVMYDVKIPMGALFTTFMLNTFI